QKSRSGRSDGLGRATVERFARHRRGNCRATVVRRRSTPTRPGSGRARSIRQGKPHGVSCWCPPQEPLHTRQPHQPLCLLEYGGSRTSWAGPPRLVFLFLYSSTVERRFTRATPL